MSGFAFFAPTTVANITVSPEVSITAPSAWRAIFIDSIDNFFPPQTISFLNIHAYFLLNGMTFIFLPSSSSRMSCLSRMKELSVELELHF